jgi:DNA repair protein RAD16
MPSTCERIGQRNKVTAVRFITKDTIEEKMGQLQDKKRLVFEGTVDSKAASLAALTEDDVSVFARVTPFLRR